MADYGGHSETERVFADNEGLAIPSWYKIQSGVIRNYDELSFDGDEMNLHMPQDPEAEAELKNLAAVQYQIVSPANNKSIIGLFQDNLLGAYRFSRSGINFTPRQAMNLLMAFNKVNLAMFKENLDTSKDGTITNFDLVTQIMPPISMKYKTKQFKEGDDYKTSNHVLHILNGKYYGGQMDKGVFGDGSKGLLQRIYSDYGEMAAANFIDNLQNIITEYMKTSSYSVGISDLISNVETKEAISRAITAKSIEVKSLIDQTHLGIFENKTGKPNVEEFETQVNNVLNTMEKDAGKIGRESLDANNRFVIMVNAGSKGSDFNITQMIAILGQQNVDGKRVPYGFENRTLPHFSKFDDSPKARGFVESSFISGLTPDELFFHAMAGRMGLIDTAVKTSQTGYIQRRLIKGLEDLKVEYDMTVRNNKGRIVQFSYGEDGIDPIRVETQYIQMIGMAPEEIYAHFQMPNDSATSDVYTTIYTAAALKRMHSQKDKLLERSADMIDFMFETRGRIVTNVFKNRDNKQVNLPVAFHHIIDNIKGQLITTSSMVDITPFETFEMIDKTMALLTSSKYASPTELFKVLYYYYLSPKDLLMVNRFNKTAIKLLLDTIVLHYQKAIVAPGEMVGMIAAQSIGEPTTQMTLNTFHFAGSAASKSNVTRGVPRIEEILSLSNNPKNPSCTVFLKKSEEKEQKSAQAVMYKLEHTTLREVVSTVQICFDPDDDNTLIDDDKIIMQQYKEFNELVNDCFDESSEEGKEKSNWIIRLELNPEQMLDKNLTMDDIHFAIKNMMKDDISCVFSDYNSDKLVFRIRMNNVIQKKKQLNKTTLLDQSDEIYMLQNFQDNLLDNLVLRGVKGINKVILRKFSDNVECEDGTYSRKDLWLLDTVGTNFMALLALNYIDVNRTITNDIQEIYRVLGIEAARQAIFNEISEVLDFDSTYINYHHLSVLCDRMTTSNKMISIFRHGINNDDIGPIAKASFEETPEMFLRAAKHGELDIMRGVSANVMCGQEGKFGTGCFQVLLDMDKLAEFNEVTDFDWTKNKEQTIEESFNIENPSDPCSLSNIAIQNNVSMIKKVDLGGETDYILDF